MSIKTQERNYKIYSYTSGTDVYGIKHLDSTYNWIKAFIRPYSHETIQNPIFSDVTLIGLTRESITDDKVVEVDNVKYSIAYIEKSSRYTQFFLRIMK